MIRVNRDRIDSRAIQQKLTGVRLKKLPKLRKLAKNGLHGTEDFRNLLDGYQIAREHLWKSQHGKCCYCEKWEERAGNDVEHYRPKSIYWWLTFTWTNLMYACEQCNSKKSARFGLLSGERLKPEAAAPGTEVPLLLDPSDTRLNPVEHIEFKWKPYLFGGPHRWVAEPRKDAQGKDSVVGDASIGVYGLNRADLFELRDRYVRLYVKPLAERLKRLRDELGNGIRDKSEAQYTCVEITGRLKPESYCVALTYDAFCHFGTDKDVQAIGLPWPKLSEIGTLV